MNSTGCRNTGYLRSLAGLARCGIAALGLLQASFVAHAEAAAQPVAAVWQAHEVQFHYLGFTTYYSCSGLEDRLKAILRQLGANDDVRVTASGCPGINEVSKMISARIRVSLPVVAASDASPSFPAISTPVTLKTLRMGESGSGECELLEAVRNQLLPALKVTVLGDDLHCVPGSASLLSRTLQVQALIPVNRL